jgi:hypothetical protein
MNMCDLPAARNMMKYERTSTERIAVAIEFECYDCALAEHLNAHVPRHDVQVRRSVRLFTRCREDYFKTLLDLLPTIQSLEIRRFRNVRIENRHVIGERASEQIPVEVIERNNKVVESPLDILL